jgi:V-type H+-transporting ATPase subunit A
MQLGFRPRLKARPSLVDLLVRAGGGSQSPSDPPHAGTPTASSPPLFSAGTAPASDRREQLAGAVAVLDQAATLPLPPSPDIPPLSASTPPSPTHLPNSIPTIVINYAPAFAPPKHTPAAIASSPSMAPVSSPLPSAACSPAHTNRQHLCLVGPRRGTNTLTRVS